MDDDDNQDSYQNQQQQGRVLQDLKILPTRTLLVCPNITAGYVQDRDTSSSDKRSRSFSQRSFSTKLEEAIRLVQALSLNLIATDTPLVQTIKPSTFIGGGHIERITKLVEEHEIVLVVVDTSLTPAQQRNLERALNAKVIDRTGLILEIFSARARTHEGRLQVELAALNFQRSRLVRSWTHLERQRGGFGFTGGPGESQIELDRRQIDHRIDYIKSELELVKHTRHLHRKARSRVPYPLIALVGYTNAGKSTLFNRLTGANVLVKDMLFATLDPTMRMLRLPSQDQIILSDTVGFITDLPHELVVAFHATLEEVEQANIILHVRDAASQSAQDEKEDVLHVLSTLNIDPAVPIVEIFNKIDLLSKEQGDELKNHKIAISALTGDGFDRLYQNLQEILHRDYQTDHICLDPTNGANYGAAYAYLYDKGRHVEMIASHPETGIQNFKVVWRDMDYQRFKQKFDIKRYIP